MWENYTNVVYRTVRVGLMGEIFTDVVYGTVTAGLIRE
jgi:hypothetical protein